MSLKADVLDIAGDLDKIADAVSTGETLKPRSRDSLVKLLRHQGTRLRNASYRAAPSMEDLEAACDHGTVVTDAER